MHGHPQRFRGTKTIQVSEIHENYKTNPILAGDPEGDVSYAPPYLIAKSDGRNPVRNLPKPKNVGL